MCRSPSSKSRTRKFHTRSASPQCSLLCVKALGNRQIITAARSHDLQLFIAASAFLPIPKRKTHRSASLRRITRQLCKSTQERASVHHVALNCQWLLVGVQEHITLNLDVLLCTQGSFKSLIVVDNNENNLVLAQHMRCPSWYSCGKSA
jgi:hypothetical protein